MSSKRKTHWSPRRRYPWRICRGNLPTLGKSRSCWTLWSKRQETGRGKIFLGQVNGHTWVLLSEICIKHPLPVLRLPGNRGIVSSLYIFKSKERNEDSSERREQYSLFPILLIRSSAETLNNHLRYYWVSGSSLRWITLVSQSRRTVCMREFSAKKSYFIERW